MRAGLSRGLLLTVLLLNDCGGRATGDPSSARAGGAAVSGRGGNASDECGATDASDGGCGSEAGEQALEDYARLRTSCSRRTQVNRAGAPLSIDYCIR
jgi:hypothetical protein